MPLRDHFRLPLRGVCSWESFLSGWANEFVRELNGSLSSAYVARPKVKTGGNNETATLEPTKRQPPPIFSVAVDFHQLDVFEVQVHREGGLEMVAAIELVSPRNKDRPTARRHFAAKCVAYLQAGVSVIVVDVVTGRRESLYAGLLDQLGLAHDPNGQSNLYAVACRTTPPDEPARLETWVESLSLGAALPTLPLWLEADLAVPLDLERSYEATFVELRVVV